MTRSSSARAATPPTRGRTRPAGLGPPPWPCRRSPRTGAATRPTWPSRTRPTGSRRSRARPARSATLSRRRPCPRTPDRGTGECPCAGSPEACHPRRTRVSPNAPRRPRGTTRTWPGPTPGTRPHRPATPSRPRLGNARRRTPPTPTRDFPHPRNPTGTAASSSAPAPRPGPCPPPDTRPCTPPRTPRRSPADACGHYSSLSKHEQHFLYLLGFARHWENASDDVSSFDDPSGLPISVR